MKGFSEWKASLDATSPVDGTGTSAVLVTFFGGDSYYRKSAERLASQCEKWGVNYSIWEYKPASSEGWRNICRKKIEFYTGLLFRLKRPVLWVDVDSEIIGDLSPLLNSKADFGAFLRNFKYLVGFDPHGFARLFHPGYVLLNTTPLGLQFASHLVQTEATADIEGTDDYVLQEAVTTFPEYLQIEIFSPRHIVTSNESVARDQACIQHADSGNVAVSRSVAAQHLPTALSVSRQKQVLFAAANDAAKAGKREDASVFLRRIRALDRDDTIALRKLLQIYDRLGEEKKYAYHYNSAKKNEATRSTALIYELGRRLAKQQFDEAERLALQIREGGDEKDVATVKSMMFKGGLDRRAKELGLSADDRVAAWWWDRPHPGNLGDIINPYIIEKLSGSPPRFTSSSPRLIGIGSIIKFAKSGDMVWGAGAPSRDTVINPEASYKAVRGPLTRELVLAAGGSCPEVYGDPAWILPRIYSPKIRKTHSVGVIRHFTHRDMPLKIGEGVREIDILRVGYNEIEEFIDEMLSCEGIVSTSLHGVIIAHAYGIPCKHAVMSGSSRQIHGDGIKFKDYFLSVGREDVEPWDLSDTGEVVAGDIARCTDLPAKEIDVDRLLRAAPFKVVRQKSLGATLASMVGQLKGLR